MFYLECNNNDFENNIIIFDQKENTDINYSIIIILISTHFFVNKKIL